MIDDWDWIDVYPLKAHCDAHFRRLLRPPGVLRALRARVLTEEMQQIEVQILPPPKVAQ